MDNEYVLSSLQEQYTFWTEYRLKRSCGSSMFSLPHLGSEIQKVTFMFLSLYVADNDGDAAGSRTALISSKRIMMMMTAHHIHAKTERVLCGAADKTDRLKALCTATAPTRPMTAMPILAQTPR